ncbi:MAG: NAD(P)/FAD-dependent oxidoreductase [Asgard group archaeon]|nr:NAD(P)/FAD-dependent oxidoreductase [Asgard group archaeon]
MASTKSPSYDVLIVGGGVAGASTARFLARAGYKVKILEAKSNVGIPVQCGEAIGKETINDILKIGVPKNSLRTEIQGFRVFSPSLKKIDYRLEKDGGYIVDRRIFDKEMLIGAAVEGADIQINTRVTYVKLDKENGVTIKGTIKGKEYTETAPVVVGADGLYSVVARDTGLSQPIEAIDLDTSVGYEMVGADIDEPTLLDLYMGNEVAPRGYIWVFPKGEHCANVGIGVGVGFAKKSVKEYLDDFLFKTPEGKRRFGNAKIIEERIGAIPVGGSLDQLATDRILLVGDAARQVNPLTGGGIAYGMEAGKMISDTLEEAFEKENFTEAFLRKRYEKLWNDAYGKSFGLGARARKVLDVITDDQMETIVETFSGEDLTQAVQGRWSQLKLGAKLLKKDPSLLKLLREALKN